MIVAELPTLPVVGVESFRAVVTVTTTEPLAVLWAVHVLQYAVTL